MFPEKLSETWEGLPLKVGTILWPPFVLSPNYPELPKPFEPDLHDGLEIRLINMVSEKLQCEPYYINHGIARNYGKIISGNNVIIICILAAPRLRFFSVLLILTKIQIFVQKVN